MTVETIKIAVDYLVENELSKLKAHLRNNFSGMAWIIENLNTSNRQDAIYKLVNELYEYDLATQLEVVELIY